MAEERRGKGEEEEEEEDVVEREEGEKKRGIETQEREKGGGRKNTLSSLSLHFPPAKTVQRKKSRSWRGEARRRRQLFKGRHGVEWWRETKRQVSLVREMEGGGKSVSFFLPTSTIT